MAEIEGLEEKKLTSPMGCRSNIIDVNTRAMIQFDAALDNRNHRSTSSLVVWSRTGELFALKTMINGDVSSCLLQRLTIKKCQSKNSDKSIIGAIIRDIHSSMNRFQEIKFQFIKRAENVYAHNLANESLRKNEETYQRRSDLTQHHSQPEGIWRNNPD
ncbi:hypothetical protein CXB51_025742 [Gossypium anomalum]|uniref:RNase H type-1 domain-containing protein n=1 Tax=Gossypium anomalum TaxID=47600 RepID=A0A8J5YK51_9ROSI|nr:hypothetical protein CXB51_025742 [Gossypium anomalum]